MAYRPTISVYINGRIVDIGYYRNWDDNNLFFEAIATAALFGECKSAYEYNQKRYGRQEIYYDLSPEYWENTEENMKELESYSEFPILVDLTSKCIYNSTGARRPEELMKLPNALEEHKNYGFYTMARIVGSKPKISVEEYRKEYPAVKKITAQNVGYVMGHCRISFEHIDMNEVLNLFRRENALQYHLSTGIVELLLKEAAPF